MSQQWEYCILTTGFYTAPLDPPRHGVYAGVTFCQSTDNIRKTVVEQQDVPLEQPETPTEMNEVLIEPRELTQIVARLGIAGWEVVSVHINRGDYGTNNMLFFKRPVEQGRPIDDAL